MNKNTIGNETVNIESAYKELACAIVYRAVEDYRDAIINLSNIHSNRMDIMKNRTIYDVERFFNKSSLFDWLDINPIYILNELHKERDSMM